jgi:hypothetical protein
MRTRSHTAVAAMIADLSLRGQESVVTRLRRELGEAGLAGVRRAAGDSRDRADVEGDLIMRADGLADARRMRDAIVIVLSLLGELDELMPDEPDRTAFHEIAGLFQDVADFAALGAIAARRAAGEESGR